MPRNNSLPVLLIVASIILPPLGVYLAQGIGRDFWINVVLTLFGWLPGVIHALWVVLSKAR